MRASVTLHTPDGVVILDVARIAANDGGITVHCETMARPGAPAISIPAGKHLAVLHGEDGRWCSQWHQPFSESVHAVAPGDDAVNLRVLLPIRIVPL